MNKLFKKGIALVGGIASLVGLNTTVVASITDNNRNIEKIQSDTPLYLELDRQATHSIQSNQADKILAWHYSHRSHSSHYSHRSHYSSRG